MDKNGGFIMKNVNFMMMSMEENDEMLKASNVARLVANQIKSDMENNVQRDFYKDVCTICTALENLNKVLSNVDEI